MKDDSVVVQRLPRRKKSARELELEKSLASEQLARVLCVWAIREAKRGFPLPCDTYGVLRRPKMGRLIVRTDAYGVPLYGIEPGDVGRLSEERRIYMATVDDDLREQWDRDLSTAVRC